MRFSKHLKLFLVLIIALFVTFFCHNPGTYAIENDNLNLYSNNDIIFYDPNNCTEATTVDNGTYIGEPYAGMTDEQLKKFAAAGINENGHGGIAFELSLLANLYEEQMCDSSCPHTAEALADYLVNGNKSGRKWFAGGTRRSYTNGYSENNGAPTSEDIAIAKSVLVEGKRTAPKGINEHDQPQDLEWIKNDGETVDKTNRSNYISGKTVIHNIYGSTYTFYAWCDGSKSKDGTATSACDPFGYTKKIEETSYSTAAPVTSNTNYAGRQILSDAALQQVQNNKPVYEEAAAEAGIPWQLLATFHYAESSLQVSNPDNGQGVYQLYTYTDGGKNSNAFLPKGKISTEEFLRQSKIAASRIKDSFNGLDPNNDDNVKRILFQYNGVASVYVERAIKMGFTEEQAKNGEGSPYVMNLYDAARDPNNEAMSEYWRGRFVGDGEWDSDSVSKRPGTFLIYKALGGGNSSNGDSFCNTTSIGSDIISQTALSLAWEGKNTHSKDDPKPEYVEAMKKAGTHYQYCASSTCAPIGASCDQFVATVMRSSGVDEEFNKGGADRSGQYMKDHPEKYMEVNFDGTNPEVLQSGDIFATYNSPGHGHIWIYVLLDGEPGRADASFNGRTAAYYKNTPAITDHQGSRHYKVYRRI